MTRNISSAKSLPQSFYNSAYNNNSNPNASVKFSDVKKTTPTNSITTTNIYYHNNANNFISNNRTHFESTLDEQRKINDKKELQEINSRLNIYVNTVRDLTQNRIYGPNESTNNIINSMKYLENDLEVLKQLYENELKILRLQIDELSNEKNKYQNEYYNHDAALRELIQKYNEHKNLNEILTKESDDLKSLNNKLLFDIENMRIEADKPIREYNHLKKEFDGLTAKFNELQARCDNETATRQALETKVRELSEENLFSKKVYEQEVENLKSQLTFARNTITDLDKKLNENRSVDTNLTNLLEKVKEKADGELEKYKAEAEEVYQKNIGYVNEQLKESKLANDKLKLDLIQMEQRNEKIQTICRNLESTVNNLETIKRSLENEIYEQKTIALKNLSDLEHKLNDVQELFIKSLETKQPAVSLNVEIETLKEILNDEESRIQQMTTPSNVTFSTTTNSMLKQQSRKPISLEPTLNTNTNTTASGTLPTSANDTTAHLNSTQNHVTNNDNEFRLNYLQNDDTEEISNQTQKYESKKYIFDRIQPASPIGPLSLSGRRIHSAKPSIQNSSLQQQIAQSIEQDLQYQQQQQQQQNNLIQDTTHPTRQLYHSQSLPNSKQNQFRSSSANINSIRASPVYSPQVSMQPLISQSGVTKDYTSEMFSSFQKSALKAKQNPLYNSVDNTVTEASYTGNVKIHEVNKNGYYVRLLNVSNNCDEDISTYTIQQMVSSMPVAVYRLPNNLNLPAGHTVTVWARTDEVEESPPHTFVWKEQEKWGTGPECTTILAKPNGQAVSWTTGCHKFGNVDYDEIASVYSKSQKRTRSAIALNREKIAPHIIFKINPTKHPHAADPASNTHPAVASPTPDTHRGSSNRPKSVNSVSSSRKVSMPTIFDNQGTQEQTSSFKSSSFQSSIINNPMFNNSLTQNLNNYETIQEDDDDDVIVNDLTYQQNIAYYRIKQN